MFLTASCQKLLACHCDNNNDQCLINVMKKIGENVEKRAENKRKDCNSNGLKKPKTLEVRKEEVSAIRNRFPTKIPIIVQRYSKEVNLPILDKSKYLVPQEITMSQFHTIIRNRMKMGPNQALYLLINNRSMLSLSLTMSEVYAEHAGPDGFLYVTYASQEVFGCQL